MTIWILALVLLVALAAVGYSQGAIRVGFSFIGLVTGALLAMPLAGIVKPILPPLGVEHPLIIWALAPFIVFILIQILFKSIGLFVHKKVDLYYKYKVGELRQALWKRLNQRLGLCLGLANATIYLVLIAMVIYPMSYFTAQTTGEAEPSRMVRLLNRAGRDLQASGFAKAAFAIAPVPTVYYDVCDILGLIYQNPLLYGRLAQYPLFLGFAEQPAFRDLGADKGFVEMLLRPAPISEVLNNDRLKTILKDKQLLMSLWERTLPCLDDLRTFLETGKSPKFDPEKILGRWVFDLNGSVVALKRARPNLRSTDLRQLRLGFFPQLKRATLIATPENQVFIKNLVRIKPTSPTTAPRTAPPQAVALSTETVDLQGSWKKIGESYRLSFTDQGKSLRLEATTEGEKLTVTGEAFPLVFRREY